MLKNSADKASACVVVFCREPRIGVGKQRLAADIGAESAARVAQLLWDCVLEDLMQWRGAIALAVADASEASWARAQLATLARTAADANNDAGNTVLVQVNGNLGERLNDVDRRLRAAGHARLVYLGSDAPAIGSDLLDSIRSGLMSADVVLAPAEDGGVVAMAAQRAWPPLAGLPWSTELLGEALANCCRAAGCALRFVRGSIDVDDRRSLERALDLLRNDTRQARRRLVSVAQPLTRGSR